MRFLITAHLMFIVSLFWWGCGLRYQEFHQEQLASEMNSWVGQHRADLIRQWGPPTQESRLLNGGGVLSYSFAQGKIYIPKDNMEGAVPQDCRKDFEFNSDGEIVNWRFYAAGRL